MREENRPRRRPRALALLAATSLALGVLVAACVGDVGTARGTARVPVCGLDGSYDLRPSFFGGYRIGRTLYVRLQNGGARADYQDHLELVFTDTDAIADRLATSSERDAEGNPVVTLRVGPDHEVGTLVHATLHLQWTCGRTKSTRAGQNVGLPAVGGTITLRAIDRGDGTGGVGSSRDPRVTDVPAMRLELRDDRPIGSPAPPGLSPDTPVGQALLEGAFHFVYRRTTAAQPFS